LSIEQQVQHVYSLNDYWFSNLDDVSNPQIYLALGALRQEREKIQLELLNISTGNVNEPHINQKILKVSVDIRAPQDITSVAFAIRVTVRDENGTIVKPQYPNDKYFHLIPNEMRKITIDVDSRNNCNNLFLFVDGWNIQDISYPLC